MNARQKAKKLKKELKRLQDILNLTIPQIMSGNLPRLETIRVIRFCDDRVPEMFIKNEVANEFGKFLMDNNFISWKVDAEYNNDMVRKVVAWIKVVKEGSDGQ